MRNGLARGSSWVLVAGRLFQMKLYHHPVLRLENNRDAKADEDGTRHKPAVSL